MRGSDAGSGDHVPRPHIPEGVKRADDDRETTRDEGGDVFDDDDTGAHLLNNAVELPPKARPLAVEARAFAGHADVLAGEAAAHDVDGLGVEAAHIGVTGSIGPMASQDGPAEGLGLDLPRHVGADASARHAPF